MGLRRPKGPKAPLNLEPPPPTHTHLEQGCVELHLVCVAPEGRSSRNHKPPSGLHLLPAQQLQVLTRP